VTRRVVCVVFAYDAGGHTVQEIADTFGVTRPTIYRHLRDT
jgi:predicted transcriptional regulator